MGVDDICLTVLLGFHLVIKLATRFWGLKKDQEYAHNEGNNDQVR